MRSFAYPEPVKTRAAVETRSTPPMTKTIPFDYLFTFDLKGIPHNKVQDVIEISMQGVFVAVAIGYSLVPAERARRAFPVSEQTSTQSPLFAPLFDNEDDALIGLLVSGIPGVVISIFEFPELSRNVRKAEVTGTAADGSFDVKFADAITSSEPDKVTIGSNGTVIVKFTNSVASGSVLRIWDRTNNILSELVNVRPPGGGILQGSSDDDDGNSPFGITPVIGPGSLTKKPPAAGDTTVDVYGTPGDSVNLFLFNNVTTGFRQIEGGPFALVSDTQVFPTRRTGHKQIPLTIGSNLQPLSPGDVLLVQDTSPGFTFLPFSAFTIPSPRLSTITLGALATGADNAGADLTCGVRLNPNAVGFLTADLPLTQMASGTLDRLFESCCTDADEISFLYSIDILSTGRELQNEPIHNVAGLGIANGDRPFRPLARPIAFEPRSFIRIQIEELSGPPGTLYIVLHGYKTLGTGRIPE
jgi:hypothetical protein